MKPKRTDTALRLTHPKKKPPEEPMLTKEEWKELKKTSYLMRSLQKTLNKTQDQLESAKRRIKKLEKIKLLHRFKRVDIEFRKNNIKVKKLEKGEIELRNAKADLLKFNFLHQQITRREGHNELKMQEIIKDYNAWFKLQGNTITFFERRQKGADWIPGDLGERS